LIGDYFLWQQAKRKGATLAQLESWQVADTKQAIKTIMETDLQLEKLSQVMSTQIYFWLKSRWRFQGAYLLTHAKAK
jgi:hypothetical protein